MRQLTTFLIFAGALAAPAFGFVPASPILYIADSQNNRVRAVNTGTGVITTVAGNGVGLFGGDGGPATSANLKNPTGVAVFTNLLYIADNENNRIRMVNLTTGIITTVAGTGAAGSGGDGGLATLAQLNGPYGVAVDVAGDLFIADTNNNRIREVNTAGTISTVAGNGTVGNGGDGGPATSAQLYHPMGVALDSLGDIYIADTDNQRIREVITGTISTVAGTGRVGYSCAAAGAATSVGLHNPTGVATPPPIFPNDVLIADTGNQCVRSVQFGTLFSNTGNGIASFGGDGKSFNDPSVELNYPTGVTMDQVSFTIYIADTVNNRIRSDTGTINTVAGNGVPGFSGDGGPATSAQLYNPTGVAVAPVPAP